MNEIAESGELPGNSGERTFTHEEIMRMKRFEAEITRLTVTHIAHEEDISIETEYDPVTRNHTIRWSRDTP